MITNNDKEVVYFHARLSDRSVVLAGVSVFYREQMLNKTRYAKSYLNNKNSVPIDPVNFPLTNRVYETLVSKDNPYDGFPAVFFTHASGGFGKRITRNSYIDDNDKAPVSAADFLKEDVGGTMSTLFFSHGPVLEEQPRKVLVLEDGLFDSEGNIAGDEAGELDISLGEIDLRD